MKVKSTEYQNCTHLDRGSVVQPAAVPGLPVENQRVADEGSATVVCLDPYNAPFVFNIHTQQ